MATSICLLMPHLPRASSIIQITNMASLSTNTVITPNTTSLSVVVKASTCAEKQESDAAAYASDVLVYLLFERWLSGSCLNITLKIGKNTQNEIALLMIIVIKSAKVSPKESIPQVFINKL